MTLGGRARFRVGLVLAAVVLGSSSLLATCDEGPIRGKGVSLETPALRVELKAHGSRLVLSTTSATGATRKRSVPVALRLRDGAGLVPLSLGKPQREGDTIVAPVILEGAAGARTTRSRLVVRTLGADVVRVDLDLGDLGDLGELVRERATAAAPAPALALALAIEAPVEGRSIFVESVGDLADVGEATGGMLLVGDDPFVLGVASSIGPLTTQLSSAGHVGNSKTLRAFSAPNPAPPSNSPKTSSLMFAVAARSQAIPGALWSALGVSTAHVRGIVGGGGENAKTRVYGLDGEGKTRVRALVDASGRFEVDVPKDVTRWYAAVDEARTSPPLYFEPGVPWELKLDVSAGGELTARVRDADGEAPLVARLAVRGIEGTLDPSFGPDYRASGAGPLIDARTGEVTTPLPAGRYRVSATRGLEWSIDSQDVTVASGGHVKVDLRPRHVVPTPSAVGCDLHVHARPSFDSLVLPEDRVLSLVAAGIEFAVPTEHNLVGDYQPALEALELEGALATVPGVEVTTYTPRFGHFGVFPYPLDAGVPPYRKTTARAIFADARRDPRRVLVVHHPRLPKDIGYFELSGFDPKKPATFAKVNLSFDALEVFNGYDLEHLDRVDTVLADYYALLDMGRRVVATGSSDAHGIQYHWAGYPRTMVSVPEERGPLDPMKVVDNLKAGHAIVTSGPMLDVLARSDSGATARPGDELRLDGKGATVEVTVHAAPWIDVTTISLVADGKVVDELPVPSRPSVTGPELGTLEEARARTLRHRVTLPVPRGVHWFMVLARGTRRADDVLAFMPHVPFALSNPIWVR